MSKVKITTAITLALTLGGVAGSMLLPTPSETTFVAFHLYFGLALTAVILFLGSSLLFVMGFGGFKAQLRRSYLLVCIGLSLIGISMFELPVLLSFGLLDNVIKNNSGLIALPFIAALIVLLFGTVTLARLFSVKGLLVRWWFLLLFIVVLCVPTIFFPHVPTAVPEATFDASNIANALVVAILVINLLHVLRIRRIASSAYTGPMAWLSLAFMSMVVVALGGLFSRLLFGDDETYIITASTLVPLVPAGFLLLRSAYAFNRITSDTSATEGVTGRNFFGKPLQPSSQTNVSSIDIVLYAAELPSNQRAIDEILDDLRMVTAHVGPDRVLSADDTTILMNTYLKIEDYLIHTEPVRSFTQQGIRQEVASALHLSLGSDQTFWSRIERQTPAPTPPVPATPMTQATH